MPHTLIDSHCHLDFSTFHDDLSEVLRKAKQSQITHFIVPAIARRNWNTVKQLSQEYSAVHAAYGLHPCFTQEHQLDDIAELEQWLDTNPAVAVGECGLDFRPTQGDQKLQLSLFASQLELAQKHQLPVIIHAVRSVTAVIDILRQYKGVTGVLHSYSGSTEQARQLLDMGFCFGFGGPVTWKNARRVKATVKYLPLEAILLESDAPDQPPERYRGQRNEPSWITEVAQEVADIKDISIEQVAATTSANTSRLFNFKT